MTERHLPERTYRQNDKSPKTWKSGHLAEMKFDPKYTGLKKSIINPVHHMTFDCQIDYQMTQIIK